MRTHSKPNFILILADDLGYGDFGAFNTAVKTPAIDRLMREGTTLTQYYSASPMCTPARAALLTGRYPQRTGAIDTIQWRGLDRLGLSEVTFADLFKAQGYVTGLIGKWHLGSFDPRYHPNARGFDEFIGFEGGWADYYQWKLWHNDRPQKSDGRYLTDVLSEEAVGFLRRHHQENFLLSLTYNAPHYPIQAPEPEVQPFLEQGKFNRGVSTLYAMVQRMDQGVGRILEELSRLGIEKNTIVLFSSDNGPQFGGAGESCLTRFNCGYRGSKSLVYEGGVRVPFVWRWPEELKAGSQVDKMVHGVDIFPTLMDAAGISVPKNLDLDGMSVLPLLQGKTEESPSQRFWQWNRYTPIGYCNAAMRDGDWKLVRPALSAAMGISQREIELDRLYVYEAERYQGLIDEPEPDRQIPEAADPELYNLAQDPLEEKNLARAHPARLKKMLQELETWFGNVAGGRRPVN